MTPDEFERAGQELFGRRWKAPMARALGVDPSTVWRQLQKDHIDGPIEAAVSCFLREKRKANRTR